ncbi:cupin domain-containing protein [Aliikangiella sp. IMCC44653]
MNTQFSANTFLKQYWQKAPALLKNFFEPPPNYLSADELAGMALEEEIESRLISSHNADWQLRHGPFLAEDFANLPESHWTLLVQSVDYWMPEFNNLLSYFSFIPRWRYDDIMVSYATHGGGVGPHFDNYDVFLLQTQGERRWRVGAKGDTQQQVSKINGLVHIGEFEPVIDVILKPGDILYVPPDTPHWGESIGESIGYSIGYRAPQTKDLIGALAEHLENACQNQFFSDEYRANANPSGKLEPELIKWAQQELVKLSANPNLIKQILGRSLSIPKIESCAEPNLQKANQLTDQQVCQLRPEINANWVAMDDFILVHLDGETFEFKLEHQGMVSELLTGKPITYFLVDEKSPEFAFYETLARIINRGYINI